MPGESPTLTFAGATKWLCIIASLPFLLKAWQGIVGREITTGYWGFGAADALLLTGREAQRYGLFSLLWGSIALVAAWGVWFFWQRNED